LREKAKQWKYPYGLNANKNWDTNEGNLTDEMDREELIIEDANQTGYTLLS